MSDNDVVEFTDVDIMLDDDIEFWRSVELRVMLRPVSERRVSRVSS